MPVSCRWSTCSGLSDQSNNAAASRGSGSVLARYLLAQSGIAKVDAARLGGVDLVKRLAVEKESADAHTAS